MTDDAMEAFKISRQPLHILVQEHLVELLENGKLEPGEQLPSEVDMAAQLGVSRSTLREALLSLQQGGYIIRKHGVGTFVAPRYGSRLEGGLERLESVLTLAARQDMEVGFDGLEVEQKPANSEFAAALQTEPGTPLTFVRRVIVVEGLAVAYMLDVAPSSILCPADLHEGFEGSVLDLLRQNDRVAVAQAVADIVALSADRWLADKLGGEAGQPVLLLQETLYDNRGEVIEFSRNYFSPDFFRFHVIRR
jgi:GntR family transcriptional regulator